MIQRRTAARLPHVGRGDSSPEWNTPPDLLLLARRALNGIDLDPASTPQANAARVRAGRFLTAADDALHPDTEWLPAGPGAVFMNPPYDTRRVAAFVDRLLAELRAGRGDRAICLTNNCTETRAGQALLRAAVAVSFPARRIVFLDAAGERRQTPLQGQMVVGIAAGRGARAFRARFVRIFSPIGVTTAIGELP